MKDIINRFVGMDTGTRARTITAAVTMILDALSVFGVISFSDEQADIIHKFVLSAVTLFVWAYMSHYTNNDYTEEACEGTGWTRYLKDRQKSQEEFWTEPLEEDDDTEEVTDDE